MSRPTLKSVAKKAGISYSVVSRVLSGRMGNTRVSEDNIAKIKAVAAELGYTPNPVAASLRSGRTSNIGLILTTTTNPFFTDMLHTFEEVATANEHSIIFNTSQEGIDSELAAVRRMLDCYACGVIVNPWTEDSQVAIQEMIGKEGIDTPVVFISQATDTGSYVRCDLVESYARATRELSRRGYGTIGYLGPLAKGDRQEGLFRVLGPGALSCDYQMPCDFTWEDGGFGDAYKAVLSHLEGGRPLAEVYVAYSDLVAQAMLRAFSEKGVRVPEDVSMVTTDNSILAKTNSVPLTSLAYPSEEIARLAIESVLEGKQIQKTLIAPMVWRGSTR
ncbi:MAG: LacI family DNA-binding transcriptional regulator [Lentisphaeria bacterium]|nr:LacI family DNA-binding transcriptional regulator [Lentisphaeria bacterium]